MKLLENEENTDDDDEEVVYEKVNEFQYLGSICWVLRMIGQERFE